MLFGLFLLLNVALLVRPEELFGNFAGGRLYLIVMCLCIPAAGAGILQRLASLGRDPISCCVLWFYVCTVLSCIWPYGVGETQTVATEFGKVIVAYFVALAALGTPRAYLNYLIVLPILIAGIAGLGLLQYHGYIDYEALAQCVQGDYDENGERIEYFRLSSSGVFSDPNDLCLVLAVGLAICGYHVIERTNILATLMSVVLAPYFVYALLLTRSRGGLLAVAAMLGSLCVSRFGVKRALPFALVGLVGLLGLASGRQASFDSGSGTAQSRIQHWNDGLQLWERAPILGIGHGMYVEEVGLVAHNSYVHAFVETGTLGGAAFFGIFFTALLGLTRAPRTQDDDDPDVAKVQHSRPFVIAALAGYCMGMYSLSRCYIIPTYLMAALASSCLWIGHPECERTWYVFDGAMFRRIVFWGLAVLAFLKLFVKVFVNYG